MTFQVHRSEKARHFVLRIGSGESLSEVFADTLRAEQVMCGWVRASGVLADVDLRAFNANRGALGATRRLAGPLQVLSLEGGVGLGEQGEPTVSLRAVLARETDSGLETIAGEIASARVLAIEALVTVLDDLALERTMDEAGVSLFSGPSNGAEPAAPRAAPVPRAPTAASAGWSTAVEASAAPAPPVAAAPRVPTAAGSAPSLAATIPQKPARVTASVVDAPVPAAGDIVEHFAFGHCEVIKSDGDRLHLRVGKEGRIREIALEMLRVTPLEDVDGKHHFKLERRI